MATELNGSRLTPKERKVLEAMAAGLYLRPKEFSPLYEIARTLSANVIAPTRLHAALFPVRYSMVMDLAKRGLIKAGDVPGESKSRFLITDEGRAALALTKPRVKDVNNGK